MKIAYISANMRLDMPSGVLNKIKGQIRLWTQSGHDVALFCISPHDDCAVKVEAEITVFREHGGFGRITDFAPMLDAIKNYSPDIIYLRFTPYYPGSIHLMKRFPTVFEMNTNDLAEYGMQHGKLKFAYHRLTRKRYIGAAAGYVTVSRELAVLYAEFGKPTVVTANGIDLSSYHVSPLPPSRRAFGPCLVFIGTPGQPWHGVDQILRFAEMEPNWTFDIIGYESTQLPAPATDNVCCHGYLTRGEYETIIQNADIAIGTLALHRKKMTEASPLKVREYLAYGLPTIIAYHDTDFPEDAPFILRLPNVDMNFCNYHDRVVSFVETWRSKRVNENDIKHLDINAKENLRLQFFQEVLEKVRGAG